MNGIVYMVMATPGDGTKVLPHDNLILELVLVPPLDINKAGFYHTYSMKDSICVDFKCTSICIFTVPLDIRASKGEVVCFLSDATLA